MKLIVKTFKDKSIDDIDKTINGQFYTTYSKLAEI